MIDLLNGRRVRCASLALLATTILSSPVLGQATSAAPPTTAPEADNGGLEEIIVTAQKRSENLQDVPMSVLAITASDALARGLSGTEGLTASVPGLVITNPANVGNPYLRGVGSALFDPSSEQSVAMYIDGVYISAPQSNIFTFNNIQQVEVLRGPQGTLFGRNATGGVIQITTREPTSTLHADAAVGYANYNDVTASGYVSGGLAPGLTADFAALYEDQGDGYGRDLTTHTPTFREAIGNYSLRSKIVFEPSSQTKITGSVDYSHSVSTNAYQKPFGVTSPIDGSSYPGPYNTYDDFNNRNQVNTGGASLRIDQGLGDLKLMNLLAYRKTVVHYDLDDDVTAVPAADIVLNPRTHNWSDEFQIIGPDRGWLKWIVGAYYYDAFGGYDSVTIDGAEQVADGQRSVSYAGFGQATAKVLPRTELTLGVRYTTEKQTFTLTYPVALVETQSFDKFTYRASLAYHFTDLVSTYASFNTGFKSGGYNLLQPGNNFKPETLNAYEVGVKTELFDRRLRFNADAFYYDDTNVQVLSAFLGGTVTSNAASAIIKGIEADFEAAPVDHLRLSGGISLQTGKYTSYPGAVALGPQGNTVAIYDAAGHKTIITPPVSGTATASYDAPLGAAGTLQPSVTVVYNDGFYWQSDNRLRQPAYTLVNVSLLWTSASKTFSGRLWAKNLTNAEYYIARLGGAGLGDVQERAAPRTFGVTLAVHM